MPAEIILDFDGTLANVSDDNELQTHTKNEIKIGGTWVLPLRKDEMGQILRDVYLYGGNIHVVTAGTYSHEFISEFFRKAYGIPLNKNSMIFHRTVNRVPNGKINLKHTPQKDSTSTNAP